MKANAPRLDELTVEWCRRRFSLPYLRRDGTGGPAVLFVHGLGGAKENFHAAFQSPALADCTLVAFDLPLPRLFLYGAVNRSLSYLPRLRASAVQVAEIPDSAHFLFYDNPVATFAAIGEFVHVHSAGRGEV